MNTATTILLWLCAIGSALTAGTVFAFSTFIMPSFARIEPAHGIAAMNTINTTILGSAFIQMFGRISQAGRSEVTSEQWLQVSHECCCTCASW